VTVKQEVVSGAPEKSHFEQVHLGQKVRCVELGENPVISGTSPSHFTLRSCQLTLWLRVDLQSPRKIVPKGLPLEVLQSAENRRSNLICGVVPEGVDNETTVTAEITCQVSTPHVTAASS
jgi:hypothetical protein